MNKMICAHGDKGGVGKSHVSLLTAAAFRSVERPLTLIDGDAKNPGLFRFFDKKPDPVLRINARRPEGIDALFEAYLEARNDVLIDLPAGGSDTTAGFTGNGTAAGTVDISALMKETGGSLVMLFVIDQGRDGIVALNDELRRLPADVLIGLLFEIIVLTRPLTVSRTGRKITPTLAARPSSICPPSIAELSRPSSQQRST